VTTREPAAALSICLKKSRVWRFFEQTALTQNMRALSSEIEFADWLLRIGEGREPTIDNDSLVHLPDQCMLDNQQEIIDFVFGRGQIDPEVLSNQNRAILCPKNVDTLVINEIVLERLLGIKFTYFSADHVLRESEDGEEFPMEMANSMTPNGMPPHSLNLKVGAVVILLKNMCTSEGLCNGTRMRVDRMNQLTVTATILYGPHGGKQFTIPRVVFPSLFD
jgi:ATP-dependent DNA helicase PIF1